MVVLFGTFQRFAARYHFGRPWGEADMNLVG